ncbi:MAG: type I pullulanase [Lachnospiraceae bacterium]|nr:type I pullulanase [Lachnospiraceae bacterium]
MVAKEPYYFGNDLGAVYGKEATSFRLWAPSAEAVTLCLYSEGDGDCLLEHIPMQESEGGTWTTVKKGNLNGIYYTYKVWHGGKMQETQDPYSVAVGVNGARSMVLDLKETDPKGFALDEGPRPERKTDIIVCEISVADTTADASCGSSYPGKYLGLMERGLKDAKGNPLGLDHLLELGVTHVQLMPSFDFGSIDESKPDEEQYNWGYDPVNYNVPEGSYSTDPFHGEVRIREFKQMIQALHKAGLGVIMDVVYNHTFDVENSCFQKVEPDYFFRKAGERYSDASACGNEVASEHPMVRKYIVESVCYWAKEYHIDGFRFDLMGVLDIVTLNELSARLHEINPSIILYGEGWTGGDSVLPEYLRAQKKNVRMLHDIGMFSDDIRDTVKGHVFYEDVKGFVNGQQNMENSVRYAATAGVWHPQVDYAGYAYTPGGTWAENPTDVVSYVSCHDNLTLWDKLTISCPKSTKEECLAMNRLAAAMVFTSQGIPFFLQGEEFGRSKPIEGSNEVSENSYNLPLYTNALRYGLLEENAELYAYYRGLIAFRKAHRGLRLSEGVEVRECIHFIDDLPENVVVFTIDYADEVLLVAYNANPKPVKVKLPDGSYDVYVDKTHAGVTPLTQMKGELSMEPVAAYVLARI